MEKEKEARLSIVIKNPESLEDAKVTIETNDEYKSLKNRINLGDTYIEPIVDKIEEHIAVYTNFTEFAEEQLRGFENTLFSISIHYDEENIIFADYITKMDEEIYKKYDMDYIDIKEKMLHKISEVVYEFNNDLKSMVKEYNENGESE